MLYHPLFYDSPPHVMLCYVVLCCTVLCYAMLCYAMLSYVAPPLVLPQPPSCQHSIAQRNIKQHNVTYLWGGCGKARGGTTEQNIVCRSTSYFANSKAQLLTTPCLIKALLVFTVGQLKQGQPMKDISNSISSSSFPTWWLYYDFFQCFRAWGGHMRHLPWEFRCFRARETRQRTCLRAHVPWGLLSTIAVSPEAFFRITQAQ